jgi:predicted unusual protein kinase regulating ubiquinone biosynthesis (AarF/ABC1/UbiB family)
MFRAMHVVCELSFHHSKSLCGLGNSVTNTDLPQKLGGIYSKITQQTRITDPTDAIYNENRQVNEEQTKQRLHEHLRTLSLDISKVQLIGTGSIGAVYRALLSDDSSLVFKVQYVGIRELWEQDLQEVRVVMQTKDVFGGWSRFQDRPSAAA